MPLMIMPANHSGSVMHYWAGRFPGRVGWLVGPRAMPKTKLRKWMPFALDNDAFTAYTKGIEWSEAAWRRMLELVRRSKLKPLWALVPDVVADRSATLQKWDQFAPVAAEFGWPLAFAVQNGMTAADIPEAAAVVFVGGTTEWKWRYLEMWTETGKRVHVGRVNELDKLFHCEKLGVESVDGTGWFRATENGRKARTLELFIEGRLEPHPELF